MRVNEIFVVVFPPNLIFFRATMVIEAEEHTMSRFRSSAEIDR